MTSLLQSFGVKVGLRVWSLMMPSFPTHVATSAGVLDLKCNLRLFHALLEDFKPLTIALLTGS